MGRGRAKAKQTKVARQLKYSTTGTDLDRLRAELSSDGSPVIPDRPVVDAARRDDDEPEDPYAAYADDADDADDADEAAEAADDAEDDAEAHSVG